MLRVMVVLPFYGGSLPIGHYCVEGLKEAGCLVDLFDSPAFHSPLAAMKDLRVSLAHREFLENNYLQVVSHAIVARAEAFQPDLILAMAQAPVSRQALKRLRKNGIPTAMWFVEDFRLFPYWRSFAPYYDIFAVIQKEPFLSALGECGAPNVLYLPLAAQPSLHRPMELSAEDRKEFGADVAFLGAGYPNRRAAFARMKKGNFKIWGTEWEEEAALAPHVQRQGARISPEEAAKIYNATAVNLNLHSSVQDGVLVGNGDFVNPRTFELCAAGAFQLVDRRGLMPDLFAEDELAVFTDFEEMEGCIAHFLAHPEERQGYVDRGRARVLRDHSYGQRMQTLLDFAATVLPGFGSRKEPEAFAVLPESLRQDLAGLVESLGLPLNASFEDILTAVRQRQGVLSPLEASLLFLDEWKKQYSRK